VNQPAPPWITIETLFISANVESVKKRRRLLRAFLIVSNIINNKFL